MPFPITPNVDVERDADGTVRQLHHLHQPYRSPSGDRLSPSALAVDYLREVANLYGIEPAMVEGIEAPEIRPPQDGPRLELADEKSLMDTTTVSFAETYRNLPIWEAGISVAVNQNPPRITSSYSTLHPTVDLDDPKGTGRSITPDTVTPERVEELLGLENEGKRPGKGRRSGQPREEASVRINGARSLIYRYDPRQRFDPESEQRSDRPLSSGPPTLPLPEVPPAIQPGKHYEVTEVLFTYPLPDWGPLNWRVFFEHTTGAVLYLRAFVACSNGYVFVTDPITAGGGPPPTGTQAALNARRTLVELEDLSPQIPGNPVPLTGRFVTLNDFEPPPSAPPTENFGHFLYNANTDNFSAVNAYYHLDALFQLMESMGFVIADYFDETSFNPGFPVPVDHMGFGGSVNAHALGNTTGTGSGGFGFGHAAAGTTVGIADDARVVAHEFCHALLWDSVHSPNFGFAHSAGDSLGAILNDPGSRAGDRFATFPWITLVNRRHDQPVGGGWAWGGVNDVGGYSSEQILCTTHFRAYRSTGGDSAELAAQRYAARYVTYLIVRAIGSLATSPITPSPTPNIFATALMNADIGTALFDDQPGGGLIKVIRWAFEQQGLYQPVGAPIPVTTVGAPPLVDVYVDDGRNGQYTYLQTFWETTDIWNRHAPDAKPLHQTPLLHRTNYAYVRVKNRGTQPATNVVVRGHHCKPSAGLLWPDDWSPMTTDSIAVPGSIAPGAETIVGPFRWTPRHRGHESMLMSVSALGDLANNDSATFFPSATGPTPIWRLVPFDNNIAQRSVIPVPGGGGRHQLIEAFEQRRFWVHNPFNHTARMEVRAILPPFLSSRGWKVVWNGAGSTPFALGSCSEREMEPRLLGGQDFSASDVALAGRVAIEVLVLADGLPVGGLTYLLDPALSAVPDEVIEDEETEEREERRERHHRHEGEQEEHAEENHRPRTIRFELDLG